MQLRILVLLILFIVAGCKSKNSILSEKEFAILYIDSLKSRHPEVKFTLNSDLSISAKLKDLEYKHFTDNAYISYKTDPDSIRNVISMYMNATIDIYNPTDKIINENIIPVIKPVEYLDDIKSLNTNKSDTVSFVYEKYNDELIIMYAEDSENNIEFFSIDDFKKTSISKDTLQAFALQNFDKKIPEIQKKGDDGTYMITAGGSHEASLILLSSLWTKENFDVDGDIVAIIPNRDILIVTGSNNKQGITKLKEMANDFYQTGNYSISPFLFKWNGYKFERFN